MALILDGTNGLSDVDGSAATPAIRGSDANTGIFFPAADTIAFAEGGVESMRLDSAGNVGIGTSSPTVRLQVHGSSGADVYTRISNTDSGTSAGLLLGLNGGEEGIVRVETNQSLTFGTNGIGRMRIDNVGNVAITQTPGLYTIDSSGGATSIANNGTVNYPLASGMLIVNNYTTGHLTIFLCGAGGVTVVANNGTQVGTFLHNPGINGYTWTNNYGSTAIFGFFFVRTRPAA